MQCFRSQKILGGGGTPYEGDNPIIPGNSNIIIPARTLIKDLLTILAVPTETKTVTPSKSQKIITPSSGKYLSKVTVSGDADLKAENVRKGTNIFGTIGTLVEGVAGIDFGTLILASSTEQVTIAHSLGVVPMWAALIPSELIIGMINYSIPYVSANFNGKIAIGRAPSSGNGIDIQTATIDKNNTSVTFRLAYGFALSDYYWIAIA